MNKKVLVFFIALTAVFAVDTSTKKKTPKDAQHSICSSCSCDSKTKILDCQELNIYELFSTEEWTSFNKSNVETNSINLSHNFISNLTAFPDMEVKILDLSHNQISWIEKRAFRNLSSLETLNLSNNRLTSAILKPDIFEGHYDPETYIPLKALKVLRLGNNELHSLDPDLFEHLPNLEELSLDSNPFKVIDHSSEIAISGINTLKRLDLSYMELSVLPKHIFHSPRALKVLNLTGNLFSFIPEALEFAINLHYLSLDENPMTNIVGINKFMIMPKLEVLSICYISLLKSIDEGGLSGLINLKELHANNNPHLGFIHPNALSSMATDNSSREIWPPMRILYLHNNNLTTLDSHLIGRWDEMEIIDIRSNPYSCDCDNQWIIDTLLPKIEAVSPEMTDNMTCAYPSQMAGINMLELDHKHSHMRCLDRFGNHPETDNRVLIGLFVGVLIGIPLTLALLMVYRRGCFGLLGQRGPADYSRAFYKQAGTDDMHI